MRGLVESFLCYCKLSPNRNPSLPCMPPFPTLRICPDSIYCLLIGVFPGGYRKLDPYFSSSFVVFFSLLIFCMKSSPHSLPTHSPRVAPPIQIFQFSGFFLERLHVGSIPTASSQYLPQLFALRSASSFFFFPLSPHPPPPHSFTRPLRLGASFIQGPIVDVSMWRTSIGGRFPSVPVSEFALSPLKFPHLIKFLPHSPFAKEVR